MAIEVSTRSFVNSHGRQPRGYGMWGFFIANHVKDEVWFVPRSMSYADAKKLAKAEAKARGADYLAVAP